MPRRVLVVALLATLAPALGAAEPTSSVGRRLRLTTVRPQVDPSHANPARVVREDANSITVVHAPDEAPITWTKEGQWLIGKVVAADDRRLTLRVSGRAQPVIVRHEDITSMAVSEWRRSRARGALVGAGIGAGAGALMGFASGDDSPGSFIAFTAGEKALILGVALIPVGALIGVVVPSAERWGEVPTDRIRLSLALVRGSGAGVSLGLAF